MYQTFIVVCLGLGKITPEVRFRKTSWFEIKSLYYVVTSITITITSVMLCT